MRCNDFQLTALQECSEPESQRLPLSVTRQGLDSAGGCDVNVVPADEAPLVRRAALQRELLQSKSMQTGGFQAPTTPIPLPPPPQQQLSVQSLLASKRASREGVKDQSGDQTVPSAL